VSLTDRQIASLPAPETGQRFHSDKSIPGFGVRISQGGTKTFVLIVGAERRKITIGRYPIISLSQARRHAKTVLARRQLGLEKPPSPRFYEVKEEFLADRKKKLRASSYRKDPARLRVFDSLAKKRIGDIEPDDVEVILLNMPVATTRHEALVRFKLLIKFAQRRRYVSNWPLDALEDNFRSGSRQRVLTDDELCKVLANARIRRLAGDQFGAIVELLVYTGQRRGQIGSLHRSHADFEGGLLTWSPEMMKAGKQHTIPMGATVRALLEPRQVNGLYFPNKYGEAFSFSSAHDRLFRRECGFADWTLHDLRRSFATAWQRLGIDIITTERMLAHSSTTGGLIGVYQRHSYLREMRAAIQTWEEYLRALLPTVA
jgi:integrase